MQAPDHMMGKVWGWESTKQKYKKNQSGFKPPRWDLLI